MKKNKLREVYEIKIKNHLIYKKQKARATAKSGYLVHIPVRPHQHYVKFQKNLIRQFQDNSQIDGRKDRSHS